MQTELRKRENKDSMGVDRKMTLTLWHRRQIIVDEKNNIEDILLRYPALGSVDQVKEFVRLGPSLAEDNRDVFDHLENTLTKYTGAMAALTKSKKTASFGHETWSRKNEFRTDADRQYVHRCCTLLCLPSLFRENIRAVLMKDIQFQSCEEPPKVTICFKEDVLSQEEGEFKVICENIVICETNGLLKAMLGLMMAI